MALVVRELTTEKELDAFVHFPFGLYQKDPYWVGELKADTKHLISTKDAFWKNASHALFMAYEGEKPVGRIMALVNRTHNEYHHENIGFFGFFDCVNDSAVSNALFQAAENWLKEQGVSAMRGPAK